MALARLRVLAVKQEPVEGTWCPPKSSDAGILLKDLKMQPNVTLNERDFNRASFSPLSPIAGLRSMGISFACELRGPDDVLNQAGHRAGAHQRVEALLGEHFLDRLAEVRFHLLLVQLFLELHQELVDHAQDDRMIKHRHHVE